MKIKLYQVIIGLLLPIAAPLQAQDLSTPEAAVRSVLTGFCKGDIGEAINCIESAKYNSLLDSMGSAQKLIPYSYTLSNVQAHIDSDNATVTTLQVSLQQGGVATVQQFTSTIKLHRSSGGWHIIANRGGPFVPGKPDPVNAAVRAMAEPRAAVASLEAARTRERIAQGCTSNLTELATAALMLLRNHDGRYDLSADSYQKFLDPYLPNRSVFRCPSDRKGADSYAFNPHIVGHLYTSISNPSTLVVIYEGRAGKLRFKHDGKAGVVSIADGSVENG